MFTVMELNGSLRDDYCLQVIAADSFTRQSGRGLGSNGAGMGGSMRRREFEMHHLQRLVFITVVFSLIIRRIEQKYYL